jgi:hypothetical protein
LVGGVLVGVIALLGRAEFCEDVHRQLEAFQQTAHDRVQAGTGDQPDSVV